MNLEFSKEASLRVRRRRLLDRSGPSRDHFGPGWSERPDSVPKDGVPRRHPLSEDNGPPRARL